MQPTQHRLPTPTGLPATRLTVRDLLPTPERSAAAFEHRFGRAALLRLPAPALVDRALLQFGLASTTPSHSTQGLSTQALIMLRSFRDMELEFLAGPSGLALLGRSPDAHVRLEHESVSKLHACVRWDDAGTTLEDLRSLNGTLISARPVIAPSPLQDGDFLRLGDAHLMFVTCATLFLQLESVRRSQPGAN